MRQRQINTIVPIRLEAPYYDFMAHMGAYDKPEEEERQIKEAHPDPYAMLSKFNSVHFLSEHPFSFNPPYNTFTYFSPFHNHLIALSHDYPHEALKIPNRPIRILHSYSGQRANPLSINRLGYDPDYSMLHTYPNIPNYGFNNKLSNSLINLLAKRYIHNSTTLQNFKNPAIDILTENYDKIKNTPQYPTDLVGTETSHWPGIELAQNLLARYHRNYHDYYYRQMLDGNRQIQSFPQYIANNIKNEPNEYKRIALHMMIEPMLESNY